MGVVGQVAPGQPWAGRQDGESTVEAVLLSPPPSPGGDQGPNWSVMVLRPSIQLRMILPFSSSVGRICGACLPWWGRSKVGMEEAELTWMARSFAGGRRASALTSIERLDLRVSNALWTCLCKLSARSGLTMTPLVPRTCKEPLWASGFPLWSGGVILFDLSHRVEHWDVKWL